MLEHQIHMEIIFEDQKLFESILYPIERLANMLNKDQVYLETTQSGFLVIFNSIGIFKEIFNIKNPELNRKRLDRAFINLWKKPQNKTIIDYFIIFKKELDKHELRFLIEIRNIDSFSLVEPVILKYYRIMDKKLIIESDSISRISIIINNFKSFQILIADFFEDLAIANIESEL